MNETEGVAVDILMSAFNGEEYIAEQLDSLLAQSQQNFRVLIRDDGSTDSTLVILRRYIQNYPEKFILVSDDLGNIGSTLSFMQLLEHAIRPYIMLADQDDVWHPDKVSESHKKLREMECRLGAHTPLLAFTDLTVVSEDLSVLAQSFWDFQKLDLGVIGSWKQLLVQNIVTGCTIIMNQPAKDVSLPFPGLKMIHDQWIAANVAKTGRIECLGVQTVLYRQHSSNVEGARRYDLRYLMRKLLTVRKNYRYFRSISRIFRGEIGVLEFVFLKIVITLKRLVR